MKKYDLIIVGGGISGVAAAVSAAREGLKVLLIEKFGSLGGAMTNSLVFPYMRHSMYNGTKMLSAGIFDEMKKRKEKYNDSSWECYRFVFDDMVEESGVEVLFHSTVFKAETDGRNIKSVFAATKSGVIEFAADFFIDASGDGELMFMTGCDYQLGREHDTLCQPMTTCFRIGGVDTEQYKKDEEKIQNLYKKLRNDGKIKNPRENILVFFGQGEGVIHFNTTRVVKLNPVDPFEISKAEIEARKQVYEMTSFLKENSVAFKNSYIISVANHIGVRESRKLKGLHILTADELINFTEFEDTIALGNYDIDIHNPEGTGTDIRYFKNTDCYFIPYRSLVPKEYDNMLVAGRCLSATHEAHSAVRIMPICACLGQAAGTAVSLASKQNCALPKINIKELQKTLTENGAVLKRPEL